MAGFANRTPIAALATHRMPVAPTSGSTQAEPILLGSTELAIVIAAAMGQIADPNKLPIDAVSGLLADLEGKDDAITALTARVAALELLIGGDAIVVFEADVFEEGVFA